MRSAAAVASADVGGARLEVVAVRVRRAGDAAVDRQVAADAFGAELAAHSLTPGPNARIALTRFEDWLSQSRG